MDESAFRLGDCVVRWWLLDGIDPDDLLKPCLDLSEDMAWIIYPNGNQVDIGYYGNGEIIVLVVSPEQDWANPLKRYRATTAAGLKRIVNQAARRAQKEVTSYE